MQSHMKMRLEGLPVEFRRTLSKARKQLGSSQAELGQRIRLPQMHISKIENGLVIPRYDTLLELVRAVGYDLLLVRGEFVPQVKYLAARGVEDEDEQSIYRLREEGGEGELY